MIQGHSYSITYGMAYTILENIIFCRPNILCSPAAETGTPVFNHSYSNDWLAQFSLNNMHKGALKHHHFHFTIPIKIYSHECTGPK